jgi:hypothetical protein
VTKKHSQECQTDRCKIIFKEQWVCLAMVAIIELDMEDGDRVEALSVKLTEGVELLYNQINGSRS